MAAVVGSLLLELIADSSKLAQGLGVAGRDVTNFERRSNQSLGRMDTRFRGTFTAIGRMSKVSFGALAAGAVGALAPILSVGAALNTAKQALTEFDQIGKRAKSSGLDPETFQQYAYAADLAGVSTDSLSSALDAFNRNAGRAAAGKGELVENLKVLNPELLESIQLARTQEERFRLVADAIKEETDASRRAAIAAAAFGDAGTKMVEMLRQGSAGLDQTAAKARELGIVVDSQLIARAEELNDEFTTATTVLNRQFQQALIALAPFLVQTAQLAANVAMAVRDIGDALQYWSGNLDNVSSGNLDQLHRNLGAERVRIEGEIMEMESTLRRLEGMNTPSAGIEAWDINVKLEERRARLSEIADEEKRINEILLSRPSFSTPATPDYDGLLDDDPVDTSGGRNKAADAAIRQAEAVRTLIGNLELERGLIGATATERRIATTLRQHGVELYSAEGQAITGLISQIDQQTAAQQRFNDALAEAQSMAVSFGTELARAFLDGEDAGNALNNIIKRMRDRLMEMAMEQIIMSLLQALGGAFGGGFSGGGFVSKLFGFDQGGFTGAGGRLEPAGVVHKGEYVLSAPAVRKAGVANLDRLHSSLKGYSEGGLVESLSSAAASFTRPMPGLAPVADLSKLTVVNKFELINEGPPMESRDGGTHSEGGMDINRIIVSPLQSAFMDGTMDGLMSRLYGLRRRGQS